MLYSWRVKRQTLINTHKQTRKNGSGRRPKHPTHEATLYASIIHQRHTLGIPLSWTDVQREMKILVPCFKASSGWIHGFKKRYNLSMRVPTAKVAASKWVGKSMGIDTKCKIQEFNKYYSTLCATHSYTIDRIINMDETPTWIDSTINKTIDVKGEKEVMIKNLEGAGRRRITSMLTCTAGGRMLKPCLVKKN